MEQHDIRADFLTALETAWVGKDACLIVNGSPRGVSHDLLWNMVMWVDEVIAVDSGLEWLERAGITPELMVGDMDSVDRDLYARYMVMGVSSIEVDPFKDDTDLELALTAARDRFHSKAVVVNFAGGYIDQEIAGLGSMGKCQIPVVAVDDHMAVVFLEAPSQEAARSEAGQPEASPAEASPAEASLAEASPAEADPTEPAQQTVGSESATAAAQSPAPIDFAQAGAAKPSHLEFSQIGLVPGDEYSVIAYDGSAVLTQKGVRWPLKSRELEGLSGLGIANVVETDDAFITVESGRAMVVLSF